VRQKEDGEYEMVSIGPTTSMRAVLAATKVEKIEAAEWTDLGMPETLWVNRVKDFGPLIISIDTKVRNLIEENKAVFNEKKKPILERINQQVRFIR
jgi:L(+)-tartrate dehydratase beta subunit